MAPGLNVGVAIYGAFGSRPARDHWVFLGKTLYYPPGAYFHPGV